MSPIAGPAVPLFELLESRTRLKTQAAIARKIGVSRALYGMWRSGRHPVPAWRIIQIVDLFKLPPTKVVKALRAQYPESVIVELAAQFLTSETS